MAQFKGRYGSIAKFYGPDATYDSVKSFFAKEITKAAQDLQNQNPSHQRTSREVPPKTKSSHRTLHLDFNDQDLSFVSEREVEVHSRHALQRPPKRLRTIPSPQLPGPFVPHVVAKETMDIGPSMSSLHDQRTLNTQRRDLTPHRPQLPPWPRESPSNSTDPEYFPSLSPQCEPPVEPQKAPKKRSFRSIARVDIDLDQSIASSSSQPGQPSAQDTESFGYVTNTGFYRCALCFSQLPSQQALDKHEQLSKLHLRNLQNPSMLSQGRNKLAQVTAVLDHRPYRASTSPTTFRPLQLSGFDTAVATREPSPRGANAQSWTDTAVSSDPSSGNLLGVQSHDAAPESSSSVEAVDPVSHLVRDLPSEAAETGGAAKIAPDEVQPGKEDKGKQRATSYGGPTASHDGPSNTTYVSETTSNVPDRPCNANPRTSENERHPLPGPSNTKATAPKPKPRLRPLEVAEILRLTGIRLAESYMAEHPDLIAETMGRVQREFTAASTTSRGADGGVGSRSVSMGITEVLHVVDEERERRRQQAQRRGHDGQEPPIPNSSSIRKDDMGSEARRKAHVSDRGGPNASGKRPHRAPHTPEVVVLD